MSVYYGSDFSIVFIFYLMIRRPLTSTLFPYTTLFRSEPLEVFKACPVAPPDALGRDEVLEGDLRSVHRDVVEDQEEDQCRCGQQVQLPVAAQAAAQTAPTGRTDRSRPDRGLFRKGSRHLKPGPCGHALLP